MRQLRPGLPVRVRVAGSRRLLRGVLVEQATDNAFPSASAPPPGCWWVAVGLRNILVRAENISLIRKPAEAALVLARHQALRTEVRVLAGALQGKRGGGILANTRGLARMEEGGFGRRRKPRQDSILANRSILAKPSAL